RIQRRQEKQKRRDHEDWFAKQKRELVAHRVQRAIQPRLLGYGQLFIWGLQKHTSQRAGLHCFGTMLMGSPLLQMVYRYGRFIATLLDAYAAFLKYLFSAILLHLAYLRCLRGQTSSYTVQSYLYMVNVLRRPPKFSWTQNNMQVYAVVSTRYQLPESTEAPSRSQSKNMMVGRRTLIKKLTPEKPIKDLQTRPITTTIEDSRAGPQKQDFRDVDCLRSLSPASSRPSCTRPLEHSTSK
ncbi:hypothetical protein GN958_ATG02048, partial [Phytophthora infestans]